MANPVLENYQSEIDKDYFRLLKELRRIYVKHFYAQADYTHYKSLLDKDVLLSEIIKKDALDKMHTSFARFKKMDEEFRLLKKQIETWNADCKNLQSKVPGLRIYSFEDLYSNMFMKDANG